MSCRESVVGMAERNIELACTLLDACGRFLYRYAETNVRRRRRRRGHASPLRRRRVDADAREADEARPLHG